MRFSDYLMWLIATFASLLFVGAVTPKHWSAPTRDVFRVLVAVSFFFLIGAYWLTTGEKFDETAYRLVLCRLHAFERCSAAPSVGSSQPAGSPQLATPTSQKERVCVTFNGQQFCE